MYSTLRSYKILIIAVSTTTSVSITVVVGLELENNVIVTNIGNSYDRRHDYVDVFIREIYLLAFKDYQSIHIESVRNEALQIRLNLPSGQSYNFISQP